MCGDLAIFEICVIDCFIPFSLQSFFWTPEIEKIKTPDITDPKFESKDWLAFMSCLSNFGEQLLLELDKSQTSRIYNKVCLIFLLLVNCLRTILLFCIFMKW